MKIEDESRTLIAEKRQRNKLREYIRKWHPEWADDYDLKPEV